tara:strand:- start:1030 stop:1803 length:774 start_codon:yes stop_codon:yes gene_type:complete
MPKNVRSKSKKSKVSKVRGHSNKPTQYKKGRFHVTRIKSNNSVNNTQNHSNKPIQYKKGRFTATVFKNNKTPPRNPTTHKSTSVKKTILNNRPNSKLQTKSITTRNNTRINNGPANEINRNNQKNNCLQKSKLTKRQLEIKKHILKLIKELAGDMTYENRIERGIENTAPFRITPMEITFNQEYKELWDGGDDDIVNAKMKYGFEVTKEEEKCLKKLFIKRRKSKKVKHNLTKPSVKGKKPKKKPKKKSKKSKKTRK